MNKNVTKASNVYSREAGAAFYDLLPQIIADAGQTGPALNITTYGAATLVIPTPNIAPYKTASFEIRFTGATESETVTITPSNSLASIGEFIPAGAVVTDTIDNDGNYLSLVDFASQYLIVSFGNLSQGNLVTFNLVVKA